MATRSWAIDALSPGDTLQLAQNVVAGRHEGIVPISLRHAQWLAGNPHARPNEPILYVARDDHARAIGYAGVFAAPLATSKGDVDVAFVATGIVAPEYRAKGLSDQIIGRVCNDYPQVVSAGGSAESQHMFRRLGFREIRRDGVYRAKTWLGGASPFVDQVRRRLGREAGASPIGRRASLLSKLLRRRLASRYTARETARLSTVTLAKIENPERPPLAWYRRTAAAIERMLEFPLFPEGRTWAKAEETYWFLARSKSVRYRCFELFDRRDELVAGAILSFVSAEQGLAVKVLDHWVADDHAGQGLLDLALAESIEAGANTLAFAEALIGHGLGSLPIRILGSRERLAYLCWCRDPSLYGEMESIRYATTDSDLPYW